MRRSLEELACVSIRVQELVQRSDGGLRPRRNFGGFRSSSGKFDALSVAVPKMKKGSVQCSGSSSQAESSSPETVPKVRGRSQCSKIQKFASFLTIIRVHQILTNTSRADFSG